VLRRPVEFAQYLAIRYTQRLADEGAVASVGSVGDSFDNALAETTIGLHKTELVRRRGPWRGIDDLELATLEWIDWYNHRRLHSAIHHLPPAEHEATFDPAKPTPTTASTEPGAVHRPDVRTQGRLTQRVTLPTTPWREARRRWSKGSVLPPMSVAPGE
jgi:putative transposase